MERNTLEGMVPVLFVSASFNSFLASFQQFSSIGFSLVHTNLMSDVLGVGVSGVTNSELTDLFDLADGGFVDLSEFKLIVRVAIKFERPNRPLDATRLLRYEPRVRAPPLGFGLSPKSRRLVTATDGPTT